MPLASGTRLDPWPDGEPKCGCGRPEPRVEADERSLLRAFPAPHERCGELRRIGGAEAVRIREILGERPDFLGRESLIPGGTELRKQPDRYDSFVSRQLASRTRRAKALRASSGVPHHTTCASARGAVGGPGRSQAVSNREERWHSRPRMPWSVVVAIGADGCCRCSPCQARAARFPERPRQRA